MDISQALELYNLPLLELMARADARRRELAGDSLETCTIINARSGRCSEDCKFCAQSVHYATGIDEYPLLPLQELADGARRAREIGSARFGIVTSGCTVSDADFDKIAAAISAIVEREGIDVCASLGCLSCSQLTRLKDAGLSRYHHNIETSRRFFPRIVTTHDFEQRLAMIRNAAAVGLSVCSGGIIGMGETREDRVDMALTLAELKVDSVPINILTPIPGTPLQDTPPLGPLEALKTVAVFRLLLPGKTIKLAAGRESVLKDYQAMAFLAGANSMIVGGYLTLRGRSVEEDQRLLEEIRNAWIN